MPDVQQQCEKYLSALHKVLKGALELWCIETRDAISLQTPVDHGILKAGTTYLIFDGPDCLIENKVPYAAAVEFGSLHKEIKGDKIYRFVGSEGYVFTKKIKAYSIPANPFFFNTIEAKLPELDLITNDALQELGDSCFK
jgi:hypothetical protein